MRLRLIALSLLMGVLSVGWALGVPQQLIQSMASSDGLSQDVSVAQVEDGTHLALQDGRTVALCGVVVPNTAEAQSSAVKFLEASLTNSEGVLLTSVTKKQQGQIIGELTLVLPGIASSELNLTSDLILKGYGSVDHQQTDCPNLLSFQIAEERAKQKRLGIWKTIPQS